MNAVIETKKDEYIALNDKRISLLRKMSKMKNESDKVSIQKQLDSGEERMRKISSEITSMS